jgi:hypothetical protein
MPETTTPSVVEATWNWRASSGDARATAGPRYRRLALIQGAVMILAATAVLFLLNHQLAARIIAGLGILVIVLGLLFPRAYRPVHAFGQGLGRAVGQLLVYLLLVPFFYLVFLPGALILRLQKRDPLHRRYRDPRWTYWIPRRGKDATDNVNRQFLREDRDARTELRPVGAVPPRREDPRP